MEKPSLENCYVWICITGTCFVVKEILVTIKIGLFGFGGCYDAPTKHMSHSAVDGEWRISLMKLRYVCM